MDIPGHYHHDSFMEKFFAAIIIAIGGSFLIGLIFVVIATIFAIPTMLLWDWLMPTLFGLKTITLFQAWGVNVLSSIIFRGYTSNSSKSSD